MNHSDIDWEYLVAILEMMESEQPLFPIEGWPARHEDARLYLVERQRTNIALGITPEDEYQPTTEQERQSLEDNYKRLHKHAHFLLDMDFIDQHDKDENIRAFPGGRRGSFWRHGYEVWPRRITAKGYVFLEMVREGEMSANESRGESLAQRLQKASTLVGTEAIKHGVGEVFKMLGNL